VQFEGAEKKAEIVINRHDGSLLTDVSETFWHQLVDQAGAKILSQIKNDHCHAYLLSESSLFVWQDRFLILTCGETNLAQAVEYFITSKPELTIMSLSFQRKNEYFSAHQPSSFGDDIERIGRYVDGKHHIVGDLSQHHHQLLSYQTRDFKQAPIRYELLAFGISQQASDRLMSDKLTCEAVLSFLGLTNALQDYKIDSHAFSPCGYSLNALKGDDYLTLHITPQPNHSYVSLVASTDITSLSEPMLTQLHPKNFDILTIGVEQPQPLACSHIAYDKVNQQQVSIEPNRLLTYTNLQRKP